MDAPSTHPQQLDTSLLKAVEVGLAGEAEQNAAPPFTTAPQDYASVAPMYEMQHPISSHSPAGSVTRVGSHSAIGDEKAPVVPVDDSGLLTGVKLFTVFISLMFCIFVSCS